MKKVLLFLILAFALSWAMLPIYDASGLPRTMPYTLVPALAFMFMPMIAAIVVQKLVYRQDVCGPLGVRFRINRWYFVAWLLPAVVAAATVAVSLALPSVSFSTDPGVIVDHLAPSLTPEQVAQVKEQMAGLPIHPLWLGLVQGLIAGLTVNAIAGFGEELGWRGLLQVELKPLGFWKSSLLIGLIWGMWHAPMILRGHNYPQHPGAGVAMMTLFCMLYAPIFSYVRIKADSVIAAAVLQGTLNGTAGLPLLVVSGGNDLTVGVTGLAGLIVLATANVGLFLYDRSLCSGRSTMSKTQEEAQSASVGGPAFRQTAGITGEFSGT